MLGTRRLRQAQRETRASCDHWKKLADGLKMRGRYELLFRYSQFRFGSFLFHKTLAAPNVTADLVARQACGTNVFADVALKQRPSFIEKFQLAKNGEVEVETIGVDIGRCRGRCYKPMRELVEQCSHIGLGCGLVRLPSPVRREWKTNANETNLENSTNNTPVNVPVLVKLLVHSRRNLKDSRMMTG